MATGQINVSVENIFPLIKKFLYSDHEIFLRELISNGTDATLKLKHLTSVGDAKVETSEKVNITPSSLPYFKEGAWYFNHVLNQNSPLLKDSVREMIRQQGGKWPTELNDYGKVRSSFSDKLEYIAVVFNGTSVLTSTSIFKTITYAKEEMFIGYKFVGESANSPLPVRSTKVQF